MTRTAPETGADNSMWSWKPSDGEEQAHLEAQHELESDQFCNHHD